MPVLEANRMAARIPAQVGPSNPAHAQGCQQAYQHGHPLDRHPARRSWFADVSTKLMVAASKQVIADIKKQVIIGILARQLELV